MTLTLDKYDQSIIGIDTPDPLRFAFAQKHSAHAGGMSRPLNPSQLVEQFNTLTQSNEFSRKKTLFVYPHSVLPCALYLL